jgi:hypothetical protein
MEIEKLINRLNGLYTALRKEGEQKYSPEINTVAFVLMDAATSLSTLQAENEKLRAEVELVQRDFDGFCEYIDSEGFLRKQFCESGNLDLEPCICPSLQEHPGYIDSDDCEGCDHFCNSWRSQKED